MQTCSQCQTTCSDEAILCPTCQAELSTYSVHAQTLKKLQANPRVTAIRIAVSNDACPVCREAQGVYSKDAVPSLPVPGCSHTNGCHCSYEPILSEIYP